MHKGELDTILTMLDYQFDIIGITETKIIKNKPPIYDMNINGYKHYSTPTESTQGGTLIYVNDHYNNKPRKYLDSIAYEAEQLESVFVEIINPGKKNHYSWLHLHTPFDGS